MDTRAVHRLLPIDQVGALASAGASRRTHDQEEPPDFPKVLASWQRPRMRKWRATPDDDEHYVCAIALQKSLAGLVDCILSEAPSDSSYRVCLRTRPRSCVRTAPLYGVPMLQPGPASESARLSQGELPPFDQRRSQTRLCRDRRPWSDLRTQSKWGC